MLVTQQQRPLVEARVRLHPVLLDRQPLTVGLEACSDYLQCEGGCSLCLLGKKPLRSSLTRAPAAAQSHLRSSRTTPAKPHAVPDPPLREPQPAGPAPPPAPPLQRLPSYSARVEAEMIAQTERGRRTRSMRDVCSAGYSQPCAKISRRLEAPLAALPSMQRQSAWTLPPRIQRRRSSRSRRANPRARGKAAGLASDEAPAQGAPAQDPAPGPPNRLRGPP